MGRWGPAGELEHVPMEWWGPFAAHGQALTLVDLVAAGMLTARQAALLWTAVERGDSLCIAAGPSGAGKSTTLTSLLGAIPGARRRVFIRGMYETFAFRRELRADQAVLLVNEISPHLPIYCWGDAVRGLLQSGRDGYQVLATAHALTPHDLVQSLAARPLRLPPALIAQLGIVAFIDAWREEDGRVTRRVREIVRLRHDPTKDALIVEPFEQTPDVDHSSLIAARETAIGRFASVPPRPTGAELRAALRAAG
jgi:hypothetical protein